MNSGFSATSVAGHRQVMLRGLRIKVGGMNVLIGHLDQVPALRGMGRQSAVRAGAGQRCVGLLLMAPAAGGVACVCAGGGGHGARFGRGARCHSQDRLPG